MPPTPKNKASFARKVSVSEEEEENIHLIVDTETDAGIRTVKVSLPAVIITELGLNTPRYVSLSNMAKAKRKPIDKIPFSDLKIDPIPPLPVEGLSIPPSRPPCIMVKDVDELMEKLKTDNLI